MSNIAEGFDRFARKEFHHFLTIAKGSCAEVRSLLYVALDAGYLDQERFETLRGQATELNLIINALRNQVSKAKPS